MLGTVDYDANPYYRIISIDPGSNMCGMSVLKLNTLTLEIEIEFVSTFFRKEVLKGREGDVEKWGERVIRNLGYAQILKRLLDKYDPNAVFCEAAFAHRIQTFKVITEQSALFTSICYNYSREVPFNTFSPSEVKANMGVDGRSGDKTLMTAALKLRKFHGNVVDLDVLDEHSIDAIAVGLKHIDEVIKCLSSKPF